MLLKWKVTKVPRGVGVARATRNVYGDNMTEQDNSVNMENAGGKTAGTYHHGDLRAAVIAAGLKRLEEGDGAELSLRALARDGEIDRQYRRWFLQKLPGGQQRLGLPMSAQLEAIIETLSAAQVE